MKMKFGWITLLFLALFCTAPANAESVDILYDDFADGLLWYVTGPAGSVTADGGALHIDGNNGPAGAVKLQTGGDNGRYYFDTDITEDYTLTLRMAVDPAAGQGTAYVCNGVSRLALEFIEGRLFFGGKSWAVAEGIHEYQAVVSGSQAEIYMDGEWLRTAALPAPDGPDDDIGFSAVGCVMRVESVQLEKNVPYQVLYDDMRGDDKMYACLNIDFTETDGVYYGKTNQADIADTRKQAELVYQLPAGAQFQGFTITNRAGSENQGYFYMQTSPDGVEWTPHYVYEDINRDDFYSKNGHRFIYQPGEGFPDTDIQYIKLILAPGSAATGGPASDTSPAVLRTEIYYKMSGSSDQTAYYVSPQAGDAGDGSQRFPFQTIDQAKREIRNRIAAGTYPPEGITVYLREGSYAGPLLFTQADSGLPGAPVVYRAYPGERVVLTTADTLRPSDFQTVTDGLVLGRLKDPNIPLVSVKLPQSATVNRIEYGKSGTMGTSLYVDGQAMQLARYPNTGYVQVSELGDILESGEHADRIRLQLRSLQGWAGAYLMGYFGRDWAWESARIQTTAENVLETETAGQFPLRPEARVCVVDALRELDAPGEWYADNQTKTLYFYPPAGWEDGAVTITLEQGSGVLLDGAENIVFQELDIQDVMENGFNIQGGGNISIVDCRLSNIGANGILAENCQNLQIRDNEINNIGACGVKLFAGNRETLTSGGAVIDNNHIYNFSQTSRTYAPAISLGGVGARATHNVIHDAPHNAIMLGQNENFVAYNEIYRVMTETDDAGAIYFGRDWTARGNVIQYNYIHDCGGFAAVYGIYLDDMASGTTVDSNVIQNVPGGILMGGGSDNAITNNVIAGSGQAGGKPILADSRGTESWFASIIPILLDNLNAVPYQSAIWQETYPELGNIQKEGYRPMRDTIRNNLIYQCSSAESIANAVKTYGNVGNNPRLQDDPGFVSADTGNFRLQSGTGLQGCTEIPCESIGLYRNENRNRLEDGRLSLGENLAVQAETDGSVRIALTAAADLGLVTVYCAVYTQDGRLAAATQASVDLDAGKSAELDLAIPADAGGERCLFFWDEDQKPIYGAEKLNL